MQLFCFGYGYVAEYVTAALLQQGWQCSGTSRSPEKAARINGFVLNDNWPLQQAGRAALQAATHVLVSIPPNTEGIDAAWKHHAQDLQGKWIGYLSTTGVYGDWQGEWVNEDSPLKATEPRSVNRIKAEQHWQRAGANLFRLAGIYGPNRNVLDAIRAGTAQRIFKAGHYFSRIHVEDSAQVLQAAISRQTRAEVFNVCDDEPAPSDEIIAYGCQLLQMNPPPLIPFEQAQLSPMAKSFYMANRLVSNNKIKDVLKVELKYPSFREGLASILHREAGV